MRYFLLMFFIFVSSGALFAEEREPFVYNAQGKRDPFWPLVSPSGAIITYDKNLDYGDLSLEGIVYDPNGKSLAIINGKVFNVGNQVVGYMLSKVEENRVILIKDNKEFVLEIRKGR
ncbi:MAG: hypothetical protein PHY73_03895 [Candidatus Omnitrophica bacterium]|nr:hypothetical protein [Candidatus Omnitrophota bacterium]